LLGRVVYAGAIGTLVPHTIEVALAGVLALAIAPLAVLAATAVLVLPPIGAPAGTAAATWNGQASAMRTISRDVFPSFTAI
jgi:hypothetical protein